MQQLNVDAGQADLQETLYVNSQWLLWLFENILEYLDSHKFQSSMIYDCATPTVRFE